MRHSSRCTSSNYGVECGLLQTNPVARVKLLNKPNVRRTVIGEATFSRLVELADPELKPILITAYDTGMREGEVLNLLSGRPNPLRHELYLPGYLTDANEPEVLAELERARPEAIVVWRRPTAEYGRGLFGEDFGRSIAGWIAERYAISPIGAPPAARGHAPFTLYRRRDGAP